MKFADIIALAKSGYTMADIRELKAMSDDMKDPEPDPKPEPKPEPDSEPDPVPDPKPDSEPDKPGEPDEPDDIKSKLDAALKEIDKLKSDLDKAQKFNSKKDIEDPDTKTPDQVVMDAFKNLL